MFGYAPTTESSASTILLSQQPSWSSVFLDLHAFIAGIQSVHVDTLLTDLI